MNGFMAGRPTASLSVEIGHVCTWDKINSFANANNYYTGKHENIQQARQIKESTCTLKRNYNN